MGENGRTASVAVDELLLLRAASETNGHVSSPMFYSETCRCGLGIRA